MDGEELIRTTNLNLDHLFSRLPENLSSAYLLDYKSGLEKLLTIVTRKVSELILSHQPTYVDELQRIADLQKSITHSIRICTQGRSYLKFIKEGSVKNGATIVDHYKRRESLAQLLDSLNSINNLRKSVCEIRNLSQEEFPKAIQKCKDGKTMLASFQEFKCVKELGLKLNDTIELIGEQVDIVLSKMCLHYEPSTYAKLQESYVLMERSEIAVDQLLMHFCSAINSQAHSIVIKHLTKLEESKNSTSNETANAENESKHEQNADTKFKKDFQELCKMLMPDQYLNYLLDLCTTFWFIMVNYKRILTWHEVDLIDNSHRGKDEDAEQKGEKEAYEQNDQALQNDKGEFKRLYIEQKLLSGLNRLWYDMKRKLSLSISNHDFSCYRFDEFIDILNIVDLFIRIGDEFCGCSSSDDLQDSINAQALNFFEAYHKSSMDELKMFLENELWEMVPVKSDFKLVQLKEFFFLSFSRTTKVAKGGAEGGLFFTQETLSQAQGQVPFERMLQASKDVTEDLFGPYLEREELLPLDKISLSSDSDDEELNKDFVEEDESPEDVKAKSYLLTRITGPVLTNSSLNVLRLIGRYIQMMSVLEPISYKILMRIYNLLDHYTMDVYKKFGPDADKKNISPKLKVVIRSIRESLIGGQTVHEQGVPNLSSIITNDLKLEATDSRKAVAVESLIYLVNQLWNLQEYLESLIPANLRPQLRAQFTQSQSIVPDFLKARAEINSYLPAT